MKNLKYARKCNNCECGMNEGFVIQGGKQYYCSKKCLHKHFTQKEYLELYDEGEGDSYWTDWEEKDFQYEEINGKLVEIKQ